MFYHYDYCNNEKFIKYKLWAVVISLSVCLFICLCFFLFVSVFVSLFVSVCCYMCVYCWYICLFISLFVCLSICLSVCHQLHVTSLPDGQSFSASVLLSLFVSLLIYRIMPLFPSVCLHDTVYVHLTVSSLLYIFERGYYYFHKCQI